MSESGGYDGTVETEWADYLGLRYWADVNAGAPRAGAVESTPLSRKTQSALMTPPFGILAPAAAPERAGPAAYS
jgi:hypothetical protein